MKQAIMGFFGIKTKKERERERLSSNTLLFSKAGLINNPDVCIKGMTTCACLCPSCQKEMMERMVELEKELNP